MKKYFLSAAFTMGVITSFSQFAYDFQRAANDYYNKGDYYSASVYYEKYLADKKEKGGPAFDPYVIESMNKKEKAAMLSRQQSIYNLAESYRLLNFYIKAEPYYKEAATFDKAAFPLAKYRYAVTLKALEKIDEAEKHFTAFLQEYVLSDQYRETAERELNNIRFTKEQMNRKDINLFTVKKAGYPLNASGASYAPSVSSNGFLFTSTRPDSAAGKNKIYINRIYQGTAAGNTFENIQRIGIPQGDNIHQGSVTFSENGNIMYFTRWTFTGNQKKTAIYTSRKNGNKWDEPVMMNAEINAAGSNTQQPYVHEKILYFSSDRAGGQGGFDIWSAKLDEAGDARMPQNMGSIINTKYDEQAPYYHNASATLVFSTNGRTGMGGYDFFYSTANNGTWAEPVNFGYPVNSLKDDIYFTSMGSAANILENIYFSSDRSAECCLELFTLNKIIPAAPVVQKVMMQMSGMVVSCNGNAPISGAVVTLVDTVNNKNLFTKTTGADGRYSFELEEFRPLKAVAVAEGFIPNAVHIKTPGNAEDIVLINPAICLFELPKTKDAAVTIDNIYYDFNKSTLRDESIATLDQLISMLNENKDMRIEIGSHTDSKGTDSYNQKLSEARARSVISFLISKGIDAARLEAKGYGESKPVAENTNADGSDNPDGRQKNRRTEFKILSKL